MDDMEDDARYPSKPYSVNYRHNYASSSSHRNTSFNREQYPNEDEEEEEEEEQQEEEDDDDDEQEDEDADEEEEEQDERHGRKRKFKSLGFEFAPRVTTEPVRTTHDSSSIDWTDKATFILVEAWGDRFLQLGRNSIRSEDWAEVAKKVSQATKTAKTDAQCRAKFDTLKKRYKAEKMKLGENGNKSSKWVYFAKMEMLMASMPHQTQLACGLDSGEYVFMNPKVYLDKANALDEMRDSLENSECSEGDDGGTNKKVKCEEDEGDSFRLLADSIQNFGKIYEKIENDKRKHMLELEKMRRDFHRELELQKTQILERAQAEIEKIRQDDDDADDHDDDDGDDDNGDDDIDASIENASE